MSLVGGADCRDRVCLRCGVHPAGAATVRRIDGDVQAAVAYHLIRTGATSVANGEHRVEHRPRRSRQIQRRALDVGPPGVGTLRQPPARLNAAAARHRRRWPADASRIERDRALVLGRAVPLYRARASLGGSAVGRGGRSRRRNPPSSGGAMVLHRDPERALHTTYAPQPHAVVVLAASLRLPRVRVIRAAATPARLRPTTPRTACRRGDSPLHRTDPSLRRPATA
jgi:hypothetical protein